MFNTFTQDYTPLGNEYVSAIFAAIPVLVLLLMLGVLRTAAHWAALGGLGIDPSLAGETNSSGGVMGKMISPQNLTVGASAIDQAGREPDIFRMTFKWSLILTIAVRILAMIQAYVLPFIIPPLGGG